MVSWGNMLLLLIVLFGVDDILGKVKESKVHHHTPACPENLIKDWRVGDGRETREAIDQGATFAPDQPRPYIPLHGGGPAVVVK